MLVRVRRSTRNPGELTGYAVALPGDTAEAGEPVWYGGGKLAADLTLPKLRCRWGELADEPFTVAERNAVRDHAAGVADRAAAQIWALAGTDPASAADTAWAAADTLHAAAAALGSRILRQAADAYDRAARAPYGRIPAPTAAGNKLRRAARLLSACGYLTHEPSFRPIVLITRLAALAEAIAVLRETQGRAAQAAAALDAAERLRAAGDPHATGDRSAARSAAVLAGAGFPAAPRSFPTGWAPAHDARWLGQADLLQTARVWGAAAAYADADPAAGSAVRKCEERLRVLHPYAMAWYDRLRSEGAGAVKAMRQAVPLFGRAPHARPGDPAAERRELAAPAWPDAASRVVATGRPQEPGPGSGPEGQAEQRGRRIAQQLQARALAERGYLLSPDELATTLGATTTLPDNVIARLAHGDDEDRLAADARGGQADDFSSDFPGRSPGDDAMHSKQPAAESATTNAGMASAHVSGSRTAAQLAAESFPLHRSRRDHCR